MPQPPVHHSRTHDWVQTLRAKGLRATTQRVAVLDFLHHHPHTDAEAIFQAVRPSLPTISLQAIHLIVQDLSGKGVIRLSARRNPPAHGTKRVLQDNHHHIQCIQCGRVEDVDCIVGHAPCIDPCDTHGMRIVKPASSFAAFAMSVTPHPNEGKKSRDK